MKDWDINIYRGVLTGYNEAFIIDGKKKDELIALDPKSVEIIRPILRGRDIKRYGYYFADLWLINSHNGIKDKNVKPIKIDDYPAIKRHLDEFFSELEKRADKGDTPYNLRNCAYIEDFLMPKIIYPETTQGASFAYDDSGLFVDKTGFMLISNTPRYLQAIMSSKLFEYAYKAFYTSVELGANGYQYNKHALLKLPIIIPNSELENKVNNCIEDENYNKLNNLVFELYQLNKSEIGFIESQ